MKEPKEKYLLVLYLLTHYPRAPMNKISALSGIKLSTLSMYKTTLIKKRTLFPIRVAQPLFHGFPTILITSGSFPYTERKDKTFIKKIEESLKEAANILLFHTDTYDFIAYIGLKNIDEFTSIKKVINKVEVKLGFKMFKTILTLDTSEVISFNVGDISGILKWNYDKINFPELPLPNNKKTPPGNIKLLEREEQMLRILVDNSYSTDVEIAYKLGISKQMVNRTKRQLIKKEVIEDTYLINPIPLSLNLISFYFIYPSGKSFKASKEAVKGIDNVFHPPILIHHNGIIHFAWLHKNFDRMKEFTSRVEHILIENGMKDYDLKNIIMDGRIEGAYSNLRYFGRMKNNQEVEGIEG